MVSLYYPVVIEIFLLLYLLLFVVYFCLQSFWQLCCYCKRTSFLDTYRYFEPKIYLKKFSNALAISVKLLYCVFMYVKKIGLENNIFQLSPSLKGSLVVIIQQVKLHWMPLSLPWKRQSRISTFKPWTSFRQLAYLKC